MRTRSLIFVLIHNLISLIFLIEPKNLNRCYKNQHNKMPCLLSSGSSRSSGTLEQLMIMSSGMIRFLICPCFGCSPRPRNKLGGSVLKDDKLYYKNYRKRKSNSILKVYFKLFFIKSTWSIPHKAKSNEGYLHQLNVLRTTGGK